MRYIIEKEFTCKYGVNQLDILSQLDTIKNRDMLHVEAEKHFGKKWNEIDDLAFSNNLDEEFLKQFIKIKGFHIIDEKKESEIKVYLYVKNNQKSDLTEEGRQLLTNFEEEYKKW